MEPWAGLVSAIAAAASAAGLHISVVAGPRAQVAPDTILLRPDNPWIGRGTDARPVRFGPGAQGRLEHYVAVAAVRASDPESAFSSLYAMAQAVLSAGSGAGWDWVDVGGIVLDETTDTPLLVSQVRLTYNE